MADSVQQKILDLLDVLCVEVGATRTAVEALAVETRSSFSEVRGEIRFGFGRAERRLGNRETRFEDGEAKANATHARLASLESRVD
jgi:hypothetical protein